ncbi:hypothetical protein CCMSSC00406_0008601 [Pleurotus cornucopiae]|uniref:Uncharacterized protein n=1 Tax=Pleurotus cornucopiae TaxID=5321 RepID=A0ACB7II82_PLECO|nr:hypothetical protein CCMSSC00406_0008601 [Pleurotus cornucopiae]
MMHQDDEIYEDLYGEEFEYLTIHVDLDSGWNPGSTLSFYAYPYRNDAFHTIVNCQKSINWTPDAPVSAPHCGEMQDDIRMEYKTGSHHADATMSWNEIWQLAKNAAYRHRQAHIKIEKTLSFGTSIAWVLVREHITFWDAPWRMCVAIEFGSSDDCVNFIQHGSHRLEHRSIDATRVRYAWWGSKYVYENGRTVIDDIHHAVYQAIPFGLDHSAAQSDAIDRGLSRSEFMQESATSSLETAMSRRSHTPSPRNSQSCVLLVDLYIETYVSLRREIDRSSAASWRILPRAHLRFPRIQILSDLLTNLIFISSPPHLINAAMRTLRERFPARRSEHRTVIINYIAGNAFFRSIHGGNIGGRNNVNHIQEIRVYFE